MDGDRAVWLMSAPMQMALFPAFRSNRDLKSAMLALCTLFLLTGLIGAFASGAAALPTKGSVAIHCYSGAVDDAGETGVVPTCCTLGCPMVSSALPGPTGDVMLARGFVSLPADPAPIAQTIPLSWRVATEFARGPPLPL